MEKVQLTKFSFANNKQIRKNLVQEKKRIEQAEERKKQRDLKKFGKKVQIAKQIERQKEKKAHMDALKDWRKNRSKFINR